MTSHLEVPDLAGRNALVTGAAHGIGLGIARRLVSVGARVIAIDHDAQTLAAADFGGDCERVHADIGPAETDELAERLLDRHGPVELVVNNVSAGTGRTFRQLDRGHLQRAHEANLAGPIMLTRRLTAALIDAGRPGSVLFTSSLHDTFVRLYPAYSMAKAAIGMLVKEMAYELAPHRIRVNAISPGWVETANPGEPTIREQHAARLIPAGRFGVPDDVARIALVLLSDAWAGYVTGINVPVDGGLALHNWLMDV